MKSFFENNETFIAHNIQRADVPWIEKLLGVSLEQKRIIDTLPLCWALFPDNPSNSLDYWGSYFNLPKVPIEDWENLPVQRYIERCEQDVRINRRLWEHIFEKLSQLYDNTEDLNRYIDYLSFKMKCAQLQEQNKWKVDLRYANENLKELFLEREKRVSELSKSMPKVPVLEVKTPPKRMYTKDGKLTKLGESWFQRLKELNLPEDTQEVEIIKQYDDPNPGSTIQLKEWLFSLGWEPDTYKETKDKDGNKKEVPQINKEKQKGGGVSDSVKRLFEREPALRSLDGLSVLNHRIPLLSSFISQSVGGYLSARVAGLTNTLRFIHTEIVNLPKVGLPFADAIRGSLIADEDTILVGSDMSGLEDRLKQHFMWPYDPKFVQDMMSDDYDPHLYIAEFAKEVSTEQRKRYALNDKAGVLDVEDKKLKPIRDIFKNGNYCMQYGAWPPKVARTCGVSLEKGQYLFDTYWKLNWSIKKIAEDQTTKKIGNETWLYNPISRFWYSLRSEKDKFSTLVQGTASFVFDKWLGYVLQENNNLIAQFHDEWVFRVSKGQEKELEEIAYKAINKLNKELSLNRELGISVQFGQRYSEIH